MARTALLIVALASLWAAVPCLAEARVLRLGRDAPDLASALAAAADGDEIVVPAGTWEGGVRIERSITLRGEPGAVIDGGGRGTVLEVQAPLVVLRELEVRGSGNGMENPRTNGGWSRGARQSIPGLPIRDLRPAIRRGPDRR